MNRQRQSQPLLVKRGNTLLKSMYLSTFIIPSGRYAYTHVHYFRPIDAGGFTSSSSQLESARLLSERESISLSHLLAPELLPAATRPPQRSHLDVWFITSFEFEIEMELTLWEGAGKEGLTEGRRGIVVSTPAFIPIGLLLVSLVANEDKSKNKGSLSCTYWYSGTRVFKDGCENFDAGWLQIIRCCNVVFTFLNLSLWALAIAGAPSRNACLVLSIDFFSSITNHRPSSSLSKNLPGGSKLLICCTMQLAYILLSALELSAYPALAALTSARKRMLPGCRFAPFPLPFRTSLSLGVITWRSISTSISIFLVFKAVV